MYEILLIAYLIIAIILIGFVMIQQGKGADMGASFGAGASNTVFGASGSGNFLTRITATLAVVFFILCLVLGNLSAGSGDSKSKFDEIEVPVNQVPAVPTDNSDVPDGN